MFSQTVEYALRAISCLAIREGERVSSGTLAKETRVPPDYLAKVLQLLARADLVVGRRGVGGGYSLKREAGSIRLLDVINAVERIERITTCPLDLPNHGPNLCPLHRKLDEAARVLIELFGDTTVADIISLPGANVPLCNAEQTTQLTVKRT